MRFWVGVTDNHWFDFLAARELDEVNFWQPSGIPPFANAPVGLPFLFKLKRPFNHVAGGGFYVTFSALPLALAWEVFGAKNGAGTLNEFRELISPLIAGHNQQGLIGCTILSNPFFFDKEDWIGELPGWSPNIVRGKMFDTDREDGRTIWESVGRRIAGGAIPKDATMESPGSYGTPVLMRPRLGQGAFRVLVTDAYRRRCAFTGENTLVALEAAHIVPFSVRSDHDVRNGLLLRADFHRLFDMGLVSVAPDFRIKVSPRIREAWFNGKIYYALDGKPLSILPERDDLRPDPDRLRWHNKEVFQA